MAREELNTSLTITETSDLLKNQLNATLVSQNHFLMGDTRISVLIFEKFYFRIGGMAGLVVTLDNQYRTTHVSIQSVATDTKMNGSDMGTGNDFVRHAFGILSPGSNRHEDFDTMFFSKADEEDLIKTVAEYIQGHPELAILDKTYDMTIDEETKENVYTCFLTFKK